LFFVLWSWVLGFWSLNLITAPILIHFDPKTKGQKSQTYSSDILKAAAAAHGANANDKTLTALNR
jgi:hypothetical protein